MAKYYVQSGNFRRVVAAESARKAAIWAVHEVMQQILPGELDAGGHDTARFQHTDEPTQKVTVLSGKVCVNEIGFDRTDANEIPTMTVVGEWNQMVMTLDRLERMFGNASAVKSTRNSRLSDDDFLSGDMAA